MPIVLFFVMLEFIYLLGGRIEYFTNHQDAMPLMRHTRREHKKIETFVPWWLDYILKNAEHLSCNDFVIM